MNPLLFMDLDGTMLPNVAADSPPDETFRLVRVPLEKNIHEYLIRTSTLEAIPELEKLYDWRWCTWWTEGANNRFGCLLGMHEHPVVELVIDRSRADSKWQAVQRIGKDRPLAWCDDQEIPAEAHEWAQERKARDIETLLITTHPQFGLTEFNITQLLEFGRKHGTPRANMPPLAKLDKAHRAKARHGLVS